MRRLSLPAAIVAAACALAPLPSSAQTAAAAWVSCLNQAADALYTQPEPASTVAAAVFSICANEELLWRAERTPYISYSDPTSVLNEVKADTATGMVLERVMVNRAARAKWRDRSPSGRAAPLYKPT